MSRWIPLKIVDLALDAKDTEIAALKKELADLKSTADRLKDERDRLECAIITGNAITPDARPE